MKPAKEKSKTRSSGEEPSVKVRSPITLKRLAFIVKKASKLFMKKGYAQTSMRDISKATGINLGSLYNYISSKDDIICLTFDQYHDPAMEWFVHSGILDIEDPEKQLKVALRQSLEHTHEVMKDILMMYRETRMLPPKFMKLVLKKENEFIKIYEDIIARGVKKKVFSVKDPFFAANMLVFQLSLYPLRSWTLKEYTRDEYLDLAEETILKAIIPNYK